MRLQRETYATIARRGVWALPVAAVLAGCSSTDIPTLSLPKVDQFMPTTARQYVATDMSAAPASPNELVDGTGNCVGGGGAPAPAPLPAAAPADQSAQTPTAAPASPVLARGVALQMTECEVVRNAGPPAQVQISASPRGERTTTMTYAAADRPIYRFVNGRLVSIERGAEPPPEPKAPAKKPARKRAATG